MESLKPKPISPGWNENEITVAEALVKKGSGLQGDPWTKNKALSEDAESTEPRSKNKHVEN